MSKVQPEKQKIIEEEKQIALKQKAEEEERIRVENQRIREWEEKFDIEQKKKEEELIKKFYSDGLPNQTKEDENTEDQKQYDTTEAKKEEDNRDI